MVGVVLDNCGVGYSAASYLQSFPFDKFKIDRAIVKDCTTRRDCAAVIASAVALAGGLGVATVAKGVETRAQFEALQAAGVDFVEGYLFGRPVPNSEISFDLPLPAQNVA
ncbi:EAL domain-containing protein (putative c-di-GMP-specific phosphodiesterase class I) [Bradyrhizobium diazoefficiens]